MSVKSRESAACSVVCPVRCETRVCRASGVLVCVQTNHYLPLTGRKSSSFITMLKALGLGEAAVELDRHTSDLRYSICTN